MRMIPNRMTTLCLKPCILPTLLVLLPVQSLAQNDSAFLDCAQFTDRGQRIACLEDALEAATPDRPAPEDEVEATAPRPENPGRDTAAIPPQASSRDDSRSAHPGDAEDERVAEFGVPGARVEQGEDGTEALHDTVTELEEVRPNQWRISLASGQVWVQVHPKRFNLREGYPVRIYPSDWGDNYRLETERLSGFIQVLRTE